MPNCIVFSRKKQSKPSNLQKVNVTVHMVLLICADLSAGVKFPPGFLFGSATASYQVEGAWNVSDKGENTWDRLVHSNPDAIKNRDNGDVACDSYHNWRDDVKIASDLGLHFYRFSISWARLLPTGLPDRISEDGRNYYNNLIDGLLEKGIQPLITLYHWDLPQRLQDLGGWTNPLIVEWFSDYARVAYTLYADRVKGWITINEPVIVCDFVYNSGIIAPPIKDPGFANYLCTKFLLLAHAKAWRIYDKEFKPKYNGKVGITNHLIWMEPFSNEYEELTENLRHYLTGLYSHPIYTKDGGWPPEIEKIIAENSKKQGYPRSRLPAFTQEEIDFIKGTYDFYGFNFYTSRLIRKARDGEILSNWPLENGCPELSAAMEVHPSWKKTESDWFWINPVGIRKMLGWLKKTYGDMEIFILENGLATKDYNLNDEDRIKYYRDHLEQIWLAITEDGVNVTRYTAWTLVDNFEWIFGYSVKFGLYEVDFEDPKRKRTPRASAKYYKEVIRTHSFDVANKNNYDEL